MKIYSVGGSVRDSLLGLKSNDLDYVMVLNNTNISLEEGFNVMREYMLNEGFKIFLETPEMVTIRGKFPKGHKNEGITGDFVLARKEIGYLDNTRKPILTLGSLYDDLERRDFSVNAMAEDEDGNIIDYFSGQRDLKNKILITPMSARTTFLDDPLRLLRANRFFITKGFRFSNDIKRAMSDPEILLKLKEVVSQERIREELLKMFKYDTIGTIRLLTNYNLLEVCFGKGMWLEPTFKSKK